MLFSAAHVGPAIAALVARHPRPEIELRSSDREVDLVGERLDIAVRIREMRSSTLRARRLGEVRAVVFGSPSYFQRRGRPNHPDELAQHDCVVRPTDGEGKAWPFHLAGRNRGVRLSGRVRTDSTAANTAVACGAGIGFAPLWLVRCLVDRGEVEIILEAFEVAWVPIHAVWLPDAGAAGEGAAVCGGDDGAAEAGAAVSSDVPDAVLAELRHSACRGRAAAGAWACLALSRKITQVILLGNYASVVIVFTLSRRGNGMDGLGVSQEVTGVGAALAGLILIYVGIAVNSYGSYRADEQRTVKGRLQMRA